MAYIGNIPAEKYSAFQKQDFTTSATTSYTLDNPVANANELALFINNVRQEPTTAYSASSTTLTLTEATSSSDDMYCVYLGKAVQTVNPPNASVGASQIVDGSITEVKFASGVSTITEADQWRLTADLTTNENPLSSNLARVDNTGFSKIGTGMSVSSGVWTFPSTGLWKIEANVLAILASTDAQIILVIRTYINSSAVDVANAVMGSSSDYTMGNTSFLYNVTDTSTHQLTFRVYSIGSGGSIRGDSTLNETHFNFIRLGDSV